MSSSKVVVVFTHFERHADQAHAAGERLVEDAAKAIESEVKARWSWTHIPVGIRRAKGRNMELSVVAGKRNRFHSIFLEYGTVFQSPRPAMHPAAARTARWFYAEARRIQRSMH